jgi:hypothetical protein
MLSFPLRLRSVNIQKTSQYTDIFKSVQAVQCARGLHIRPLSHSTSAKDRHNFNIFVQINEV